MGWEGLGRAGAGLGWDGLGWAGVGWAGMGWGGLGWDGWMHMRVHGCIQCMDVRIDRCMDGCMETYTSRVLDRLKRT